MVFLVAGDDLPIFLLTAFAKNEKANHSTKERAMLVGTARQMIEDYRSRE